MKPSEEKIPTTLFAFIWYFLKEFKFAVVVFVSLALIAGVWGPFNSLLIKHIVDLLPNVPYSGASQLLLPVGLIVLNFIVFDNFTWRTISYIQGKYVPLIMQHIIAKSMDYVLGHSNRFFQERLTGKISKQIINLAEGVGQLITPIMSNFLRGFSLIFVACVTAYWVNPIFGLILITWFIFFASISALMSKKLVTLSDMQASQESIVTGEVVDTLSNQSNIRIFARKQHENQRIMPYLNNWCSAYRNTHFYGLAMHIMQGGLIAIMMACSAYALVKLYAAQLVTIGDFVLIFGLTMEAGHMMWFTTQQLDAFNKEVGRCRQSLSALFIPLEVTDKHNAKPLRNVSGHILFQDISFHYKGTDPLFKNKYVEIIAGQKVGLVGYSGGGKTTFANLIMRLYDVTDGAILIDGQDIRDVTQDSLHENIAMIPQDPVLFQRTIMENMRYGNIDATDDEVIKAAKKAHAHEFIKQLPEGYNSLVGERGVKLSGGQRQRIAISRAVLKNAPILILDEATSQLDSITEGDIQASLWELMQGKTTIVIAHRLSTLLHMDRILVFNKGEIVEDGAHQELLERDKLYKQLWDAQIGGFLGDDI